MNDQTTDVYWLDLNPTSYPFVVLPDIEMLFPGGKQVTREIKNTGDKEPKPYRITYDRSYVVCWLATRFLDDRKTVKGFKHMPFNDLQKVISEAYKLSKQAITLNPIDLLRNNRDAI